MGHLYLLVGLDVCNITRNDLLPNLVQAMTPAKLEQEELEEALDLVTQGAALWALHTAQMAHYEPKYDRAVMVVQEHRRLESLRGAKGDIPVGVGVIADKCPSCSGRALFVGSGGWITCSVIGCKQPCLEQWMESHLAAPPERFSREEKAALAIAESACRNLDEHRGVLLHVQGVKEAAATLRAMLERKDVV